MKHVALGIRLSLGLAFTGCAGSTSFLGDFVDTEIAPGGSQQVILEFEAEGSHAGDYDFSATVSSGDGLTATVSPQRMEVDGVVDVAVTISADAGAESGSGSVYVEGSDGSNGAGTTISVTIL